MKAPHTYRNCERRYYFRCYLFHLFIYQPVEESVKWIFQGISVRVHHISVCIFFVFLELLGVPSPPHVILYRLYDGYTVYNITRVPIVYLYVHKYIVNSYPRAFISVGPSRPRLRITATRARSGHCSIHFPRLFRRLVQPPILHISIGIREYNIRAPQVVFRHIIIHVFFGR